MLPMAVTRSSSGKGAIFGFSFPLTMHCNAFAAKGIGREGGDGSAQRGRSVVYMIALFLHLLSMMTA